MQVNHEIVDGEDYVDILLTRDELYDLRDNFLLSQTAKILGKKVNIGIALIYKSEKRNAPDQEQEQKSGI